MSQRFQILSLDGGGLKGLFSAALLAQLEADLGICITDHFDLITGTSTGGLIALALGHGLRPAEIVEIYAGLGSSVFGHPRGRLRSALRPRHGAERLRLALEGIFGDTKLDQSFKRLMVPAYSLSSTPDVYIFKTPHHWRFTRDGHELMVDVALATTAAPTYLPAAELRNLPLVDGGVWANDPSLISIAEAHSTLDVDLADISILSLGTTAEVVAPHPRLEAGGWFTWAFHGGAQLLLRAQALGSYHTAEHLLRRDKGRFIRIDQVVPKDLFALDRIDTKRMLGLAEDVSRRTSEMVTPLTDHLAPEYTPYPKRPEGAVAP